MLVKRLRYAKYYAGVIFRNWRSKKESFAQHREDLLVEQFLPKVQSFIDIGANDGVLFPILTNSQNQELAGFAWSLLRQHFSNYILTNSSIIKSSAFGRLYPTNQGHYLLSKTAMRLSSLVFPMQLIRKQTPLPPLRYLHLLLTKSWTSTKAFGKPTLFR